MKAWPFILMKFKTLIHGLRNITKYFLVLLIAHFQCIGHIVISRWWWWYFRVGEKEC